MGRGRLVDASAHSSTERGVYVTEPPGLCGCKRRNRTPPPPTNAREARSIPTSRTSAGRGGPISSDKISFNTGATRAPIGGICYQNWQN